jgi:membrane fusion protein (multidrug efflux system)
MAKNNKVLLVIAIAGSIALLLAVPKLMAPSASAPVRKQSTGRPAVAVSVRVAEPAPMREKIVATGTIRASSDVEIKSEASGRVVAVHFNEGAVVEKNRLLVKVNDADLQAQLRKAQAALNLAQQKERRQKELLAQEVISTEDYQTSVKDLEGCQADMQAISSQIEKTDIRAPFSGIIGLSNVTVGTYLTVGSKIANLVCLAPLDIESSIPERYAGAISAGTMVTFTTAGSPAAYHARVTAKEPKIDEATRTVAFKARCTDADRKVVAGSFAQLEIGLDRPNGVMVPSDAIISDIDGYKVYLVKKGQAVAKVVATGYRDEKGVEITSGIAPGDTIVVSGVFMLRPGTPVEAKSEVIGDQ